MHHAMLNLSSESYTKAEQAARGAAHDYVNVLRRHVPGFEQAYLASTGPQIGARESRHPPARYDLTADDLRTGRQRSESITKAAWPIEDHSVPGKCQRRTKTAPCTGAKVRQLAGSDLSKTAPLYWV